MSFFNGANGVAFEPPLLSPQMSKLEFSHEDLSPRRHGVHGERQKGVKKDKNNKIFIRQR
jgi:hypothetical protein